MNRRDRVFLLSERETVQRFLAETPQENVIERGSWESRLKDIEARLADATADEAEPARVRLTFKGRPVVGTHGIAADFGMKAVNSFSEAVASLAASLAGPLAASGPIPNREQYQLLITSTALGSFGFELEEFRAAQLPLERDSPMAQALERTHDLLRSTLGDDEELADAASETDPRALDRLRGFLQVLADGDAVCTLQWNERSVQFADVAQVRASLARLSRDNLHEEECSLAGSFIGALPHGRTPLFEFRLSEGGEVIRGKVAAAVHDIEQINRHLYEAVDIRVMQTRVGGGKPRYLLLSLPRWIETDGGA